MQHRLRQVDVPEISDGKVLLDSEASTHVSGSLNLFSSRERLSQPQTIHLAVADCTVDVRFKGTVTIRTNKGPMTFHNVFYCPGVDGVILSIGRLTSEGWNVLFEHSRAEVLDPNLVSYPTLYKNFCWSIDVN